MSSVEDSIRVSPRVHASRQFDNRRENSLAAVFSKLDPDIRSQWAWDNYRAAVIALAREFGLSRLLEIGGGRDPLLAPEDAEALGLTYTINDISAEELRNAPGAFEKVCFDVSADLSRADVRQGSYDLAFSRMVFEHVKDAAAGWSNLNALLVPGGVAMAFVPTLYALPYIANLAIPEWLSQRIVKLLYPHRTDDGDPKFPAYYDWCYASERRVGPMLRDAGFREILVLPFFGHQYFERLPIIRELDDSLTRLAIRLDWRALAPYAYVLARK